MPKDFVEAGYSDTAVIGDATEVWISQSENYDLNNITFSSYKNHTTGKMCMDSTSWVSYPLYRCISWKYQ